MGILSASYPSLKGKRVVVTGGGSGIGAAIVDAFARQAARVTFLDIADSESEALERSLSGLMEPPRYLRCDLTELAQIRSVFERLERELGPIEILVNNAANDQRHELNDIAPASFDANVAVNLRHLLFSAQAVAPGMQAAGKGVIINLGSISWHLALPNLVMYETAKAGIEGMTRALARDLGPYGIRVNCVIPGGIRTPRQTRLWHNPEEEARMLGQQCLKGRIEPEHVAAMVLFLASDDARMCTGHGYFVDAGWR
jgi:D-xylose 1-dehydrogenase